MPIWADSAFLNTDVFGIMNYGEGHDDADEYELEKEMEFNRSKLCTAIPNRFHELYWHYWVIAK